MVNSFFLRTCKSKCQSIFTSVVVSLLGLTSGEVALANSTQVDMFPTLQSVKAKNGFGYVVDFRDSEDQLQLAQRGGATYVRMPFRWSEVETLNRNGQLARSLTPAHRDALERASDLNLKVNILASNNPGWDKVDFLAGQSSRDSVVTVARDVRPGSTQIFIEESLRDIQQQHGFRLGQDVVRLQGQGPGRISPRHGFAGTLIARYNYDQNAIVLASATNPGQRIEAGTKLLLNRYRYRSPGNENPNSPSIQAYRRYANFLASQVGNEVSRGGIIELLNEPPWKDEKWDLRGNYYDTPPANIVKKPRPNVGILKAILDGTAPPSSIRYNWGGPHTTGNRDGVLSAGTSATANNVNRKVKYESWHLYEGESALWSRANPVQLLDPLPGEENRSKRGIGYKQIRDEAQKQGGAKVKLSVTEFGFCNSGNEDLPQARHMIRNYLSYLSRGVDYMIAYRLKAEAREKFADQQLDPANNCFSVYEVDGNPRPAYTAMRRLISRFRRLGGASVNNAVIPKIIDYRNGTKPLSVVPVVGRDDGTPVVSLFLWQRTTLRSGGIRVGENKVIERLDRGAVVEVEIPEGYRVADVRNFVQNRKKNIEIQGNKLIVRAVKDDPILVVLR